jgi:hypothetical protein
VADQTGAAGSGGDQTLITNPPREGALAALGLYRDAVLLITSADYVLGYIVWATLAYRERLGPLPVLDAQYFIAGAPVLIVAVLCVLILFAANKALSRWIGSMLFFVPATQENTRSGRHLLAATLYLLLVPAVISLGLFAIKEYQSVPEALGGARPRCAQFDLRPSDVSRATLIELGVSANESRDSVVRSNRLVVFHAGLESVVVRRADSLHATRTVELSRAAVRAISWCD